MGKIEQALEESSPGELGFVLKNPGTPVGREVKRLLDDQGTSYRKSGDDEDLNFGRRSSFELVVKFKTGLEYETSHVKEVLELIYGADTVAEYNIE